MYCLYLPFLSIWFLFFTEQNYLEYERQCLVFFYLIRVLKGDFRILE